MSIISYNWLGYNDVKSYYINTLLKECDVLFLQEHWVLHGSLHKLYNISSEFNVYAKSGMKEHELLIGRPYGGCAIFVNKTMKCASKMIDTDNVRVCAVLSDFHDYVILFISVYMPGDLSCNIDEYNDVLSTILALQSQHTPQFIICGGDWNTDLSRLPSKHTTSLSRFCTVENLTCVNSTDGSVKFTYVSDMNGARSTIDHFIIANYLSNFVNKLCVRDDIENQSDHLPICISITLPVQQIHFNDARKFISKPKWFVANEDMLNRYRLELDNVLSKVQIPTIVLQCKQTLCNQHNLHVHLFHDHIIHTCIVAAERVIPFTKPHVKRKNGKAGWNDHVSADFHNALHWHSIYLNAGSPQSGFIFEMRKQARSVYHKQINFISKQGKKLQKEKIATAFIENKSRDFWSEISKIRRKTQRNTCIVDGYSNDYDISLCFSRHYHDLYNSVEFDSDEWTKLYNTVCEEINVDCEDSYNHTIHVDDVIRSIKCLKSGKSDGFDGLTSDYIINGSPLLFKYISCLFTCMLSHCYIPTSFSVSTMIPIPKGSNKDLTDVKNYRGIALSSLLSKVFGYCIIYNHASVFESDELQFAYKKNCSTVQCVSMVTEVINYYVNNGSTVYMSMLDVSKAFDRVNLLILFRKLYDRGLCPSYLRFLMILYREQTMRIRWNGTLSDIFTVSNGVKQGGVLSPLLFSMYLDDLLIQLRQLGMGCHINGLYTGAFIYADDITLIAPSRTSMTMMLKQCEKYAEMHAILFNPSKTKYMVFKQSLDIVHHVPLYFMNTCIELVHECDLLGISLSSDNIHILDNNITDAVSKFNRKSNELLSDFKIVSCSIKSTLFSTFCLDAYGSSLWCYSSKSVESFYVAWRKVVRRIWRLPNKTHCILLPSINNTLPIDVTLEKRCIKFIWSCINSENTVVAEIAKFAMRLPRSIMGDNYRYLSYKYTISPIEWFGSIKTLHQLIDRYVLLKIPEPHFASIIRELCFCRDSTDPFVLTSREAVQLIEYLCTI